MVKVGIVSAFSCVQSKAPRSIVFELFDLKKKYIDAKKG